MRHNFWKLGLSFGLALALLLLVLRPALGQAIGGFVRVDSLERKIEPEVVFEGQPFKLYLRVAATLVKDLPLNTDVEAQYDVIAKLNKGDEKGVLVGKGEIKVGPLPSAKAGARIEQSETVPLTFPKGSQPATYTLFMEPTSIKPPWIWLFADLIFPGLLSFSFEVGQVKYLGFLPEAAGIGLNISAPGEVRAALPFPVEIEVQAPWAEAALVELNLYDGQGTRVVQKEVTLPTARHSQEMVLAPTTGGEFRLQTELKGFIVQGSSVAPPAPLSKGLTLRVKTTYQSTGLIDNVGVVQRAFEVVSPDGRARLLFTPGSRAVSGQEPLVWLTIDSTPVPTAPEGHQLVGKAYSFQPSAIFEPPLEIALSYKEILPKGISEHKLSVASYSSQEGWVRLPTQLDQERGAVKARVEQTSTLAIIAPVGKAATTWVVLLVGSLVALGVGGCLVARSLRKQSGPGQRR